MFKSHHPDSWFALFVITGKEEKVKEWLERKFQDTIRFLVPRRRLRERKDGRWNETNRILFPGYVLIHGSVSPEVYSEMKHTPDLIKLLRSGNDLLEIQPNEMEILGKLICNGETIGYSEILLENDRIVVLDGPLVSLEGNILCIDKRKGRAKVQVSFMGEPRTIDLGVSILKKV